MSPSPRPIEALAEPDISSASLLTLSKLLDLALVKWGQKWGIPRFAGNVHYTFSERLRGSLGRCHQQTGMVQLNHLLRRPANRLLLFETLAHESAHIAAYLLHGPSVQPHGPEWKWLLQQAGFKPRSAIPSGGIDGFHVGPPTRRPLYQYLCPVCQLRHVAPGKSSRLRCRVCVDAGRPGVLEVTRVTVSATAKRKGDNE